MEDLDSRTEEINKMLEDIEEETATLIEEFERKYIRFIQEASWTSEEYIDDNIYYFDAETTLHKASQPKASYTINVIELSQLEEYKDYVFDLGDITYIQDPDFFGWV
jgi:DNA-binding winged helix-turn-helix (wHTH) protein